MVERESLVSMIKYNNESDIRRLLETGFDPNYSNGLPLRTAARNGCHKVAHLLILFGANPHLPGESGVSTLQLAVYSRKNWEGENWSFLLSCFDSSQLADAAAVAIVFKNLFALEQIINTGRCNLHIPTTLTGKTVEALAYGYNLAHLMTNRRESEERLLPSILHTSRLRVPINQTSNTTQNSPRALSPSVARFFELTSSQRELTTIPSILQGAPTSPYSPLNRLIS